MPYAPHIGQVKATTTSLAHEKSVTDSQKKCESIGCSDFCGADQHQQVTRIGTKSHSHMWNQIDIVNDIAPEILDMWSLSTVIMCRRQLILDRKSVVVSTKAWSLALPYIGQDSHFNPLLFTFLAYLKHLQILSQITCQSSPHRTLVPPPCKNLYW